MSNLIIARTDLPSTLVHQFLTSNPEKASSLKVSIEDVAASTLTLEDGTIIDTPNTILSHLASSIDEKFAGDKEEPAVQADIQQWLSASSVANEELSQFSKNVNTHLSGKSFICGGRMTLADVAIYARLRAHIAQLPLDDQKTMLNTMRWFNQVQSQLEASKTLANANVEAVTIDLEALNLGGKKKKDKKAPAKKEEKKDSPIVPSMIDLRVGNIVEVAKHEAADSLYVEQIELGETEPRTVVSGLVKHFTLEEMKGRNVVLVCNLKPASMRGVKSFAMVLCATTAEGKVEFVTPPEGSQPGDRVFFEGFEGQEPEAVLNPKKKIWETIQLGLKTNDTCIAGWIDPTTNAFHTLKTQRGICTTPTATNAPLK
ncbi:G4 quadruplex nucleic acid binding protein [Entomophthora muscae]|uniref:G4 quadruplex nucleic acid binding protein n=1 Tax=Entomophthora muscae TaxID=34485 RepID=A0ACC2RGG9_9FUNG|nr:G4 quadruplex nucleic acid binding protein [Entomophthora muscae]